MAVDTNINQFRQGKAVGDLDLNFFGAESVIDARYNPEATSTDRLKAGEAVILVDLGADDVAGPPIVSKRTVETAGIFGVVVRSLKTAEHKPGDVLRIAVAGSVMNFKAGAALARGAAVTPVIATPGNVVAVTTKAPLGYLLDKAGSGDIVRVMLTAGQLSVGSA